MDLEEKFLESVQLGDIQSVLQLISSGVCLNVVLETNDEKHTPLLAAVLLADAQVSLCISQILLLHGADPNLKTGGNLPLHEAARLGRHELVSLLLESGAKPKRRDFNDKTALEIGRAEGRKDIIDLLLGNQDHVSVKFNRYIFENETEEKENSEESKSTDFLREIEKIFSADITGADINSDQNNMSGIVEDIAEVAEQLEEIGFKTPNIYSAKTRTCERRLEHLTKDGYQDKVSKFLESMEPTNDIKENPVPAAVSETPVRKEKSYLRQTLASSRKRRILLDAETNSKSATPLKKTTKTIDATNTLPLSNLPLSRFSTLESSSSVCTGINSLAVSLANTSSLSVCEEYIIKDSSTGLELVEKRLPSLLGLAMQDEALLNLLEEGAEEPVDRSNNFSLGSMSDYSSSRIKHELEIFGELPTGPITSNTKRAYLLRLKKLRLGLVVPGAYLTEKYPNPLAESLRNVSCITKNWEQLWKLENEMSDRFVCVDPVMAEGINFLTRESVCKSSFNYLLLDPRKSQNLPFKVFSWGDQDLWKTFIDSIFYIGKGSRSRPFQHLYDACKRNVSRKKSSKVERILEIWDAGFGVVSLQVFNNCIAVEGFTREAAMIDAIGLDNLSNVKPGDYYGPAVTWEKNNQQQLGTFLLYRAFKIFLQEGERQIRSVDLKTK